MGYPSPSCMIGHEPEDGTRPATRLGNFGGGNAADTCAIFWAFARQMAVGIRTLIFRESIYYTRGQSTL